MFRKPSNRQFKNFVMVGLICLCMSGVCLAQPDRLQNPRSTQSSNDEFWNVLGLAFKEASNNRQNFSRLLDHADVQKELRLDESQAKAIEKLNIKYFEELQALREKNRTDFDKDKVRKELVEVINRQDAEFVDQIAKSCNLDRLIQIEVQAYDIRAITHTEVARRVGISAEKLSDLRCLSDQIRREEMENIGDSMKDVLRNRGPNSREKVRQLFAEIDKKINDSLRMKLTSQELESLQQLRGNQFEIPEDLFDPRRRGGNRGVGGGRNDRNNDPKDRDQNRDNNKENCYRYWSVEKHLCC